jgi:transposase
VEEIGTIGIDLAKHVFQLHGSAADGTVLFRRRLRRERLLEFLASQPSCVVAMEAFASAHFWARELQRLGHAVRLIAPVYVKPFAKRQKNDMADAEAICEAAQRPTMRFVAVESEAPQASAMTFEARDLLVRQPIANGATRSTPCVAIWRSSASSRRRALPMSAGWQSCSTTAPAISRIRCERSCGIWSG